MECNEIITNIIMPIVSALIGGGLTLVGVLITIKSENKKRKEEIRIANKPLFYVINPMQKYEYKNSSDFEFRNEDDEKSDGFIPIIFKNTDNAILVLDYISINGKKYYSMNGNIVDKNTTFNIYLYVCNEAKVDFNANIVFAIKDSIGTRYKYELSFHDEKSEYITQSEEIK